MALGYGEDLRFCLQEDCSRAVPLRLPGEEAFRAARA